MRGCGRTGPRIGSDALKLHTYGILASIQRGEAGYICDDYLDALDVDTNTPALELDLAGLWVREGNGYRVSDQETLRVARLVHHQLKELEAQRLRS